MTKDKSRFLLLIVPLSEIAQLDMAKVFRSERLAIYVPEWGEFFLMKFLKKTGLTSCLQYRAVYPRRDGAFYLFDVLDSPRHR